MISLNPLLEHLQHQYLQKKILILGFGREGQSTYRVLRAALPNQKIFISDQEPLQLSDQDLIFDPGYLNNLLDYDVIFKTPGISVWQPELQAYLSAGKTLTSQLNEFLPIYKKQIIGI